MSILSSQDNDTLIQQLLAKGFSEEQLRSRPQFNRALKELIPNGSGIFTDKAYQYYMQCPSSYPQQFSLQQYTNSNDFVQNVVDYVLDSQRLPNYVQNYAILNHYLNECGFLEDFTQDAHKLGFTDVTVEKLKNAILSSYVRKTTATLPNENKNKSNAIKKMSSTPSTPRRNLYLTNNTNTNSVPQSPIVSIGQTGLINNNSNSNSLVPYTNNTNLSHGNVYGESLYNNSNANNFMIPYTNTNPINENKLYESMNQSTSTPSSPYRTSLISTTSPFAINNNSNTIIPSNQYSTQTFASTPAPPPYSSINEGLNSKNDLVSYTQPTPSYGNQELKYYGNATPNNFVAENKYNGIGIGSTALSYPYENAKMYRNDNTRAAITDRQNFSPLFFNGDMRPIMNQFTQLVERDRQKEIGHSGVDVGLLQNLNDAQSKIQQLQRELKEQQQRFPIEVSNLAQREIETKIHPLYQYYSNYLMNPDNNTKQFPDFAYFMGLSQIMLEAIADLARLIANQCAANAQQAVDWRAMLYHFDETKCDFLQNIQNVISINLPQLRINSTQLNNPNSLNGFVNAINSLKDQLYQVIMSNISQNNAQFVNQMLSDLLLISERNEENTVYQTLQNQINQARMYESNLQNSFKNKALLQDTLGLMQQDFDDSQLRLNLITQIQTRIAPLLSNVFNVVQNEATIFSQQQYNNNVGARMFKTPINNRGVKRTGLEQQQQYNSNTPVYTFSVDTNNPGDIKKQRMTTTNISQNQGTIS